MQLVRQPLVPNDRLLGFRSHPLAELHQHADRVELLGRSGERRLQGGDRHARHIRQRAHRRHLLATPARALATVDVDERDAHTLPSQLTENSAPSPEAPPLTNAVRPRRLGYVANTGCSIASTLIADSYVRDKCVPTSLALT